MFTEPTTFLLGAGANCPFGYPAGRGLVEAILKLSPTVLNRYSRTPEAYEGQFRTFVGELSRSKWPSIDAFLENRSEFSDIGKLPAAHVLIECEDENKLLATDDWYSLLLSKLGSRLDLVPKNNLRILTFNYDRSLEHFLYESLKSRFGPDATKINAAASIPITHIYGSLGKLPWVKKQDANYIRPYGESSADSVREAAKNLRLIHEAENSVGLLRTITTTLQTSTTIYILGFGFHPENMRLLRNGLDGKNPRATFYDYTPAEHKAVESQYGVPVREYSNMTAKMFLRHDTVFAATADPV